MVEKISGNNFALSDAENNILGPLNIVVIITDLCGRT